MGKQIENNKPMDRKAIMAVFRSLAQSQGMYGRLIAMIESLSETRQEKFWSLLESKKFTDTVDLVMYVETEL
jgi:hypothetical protein